MAGSTERTRRIALEIEVLTACIWIGDHLLEVRAAADEEWDETLLLVMEGAAVDYPAARLAARAVLDLDANVLSWLPEDTARARRAIADLLTWNEQPDDALHPAAVRAFGPVLADLFRTGGPVLRVEHRGVDPGENLSLLVRAPDGSGTGVWVDQFGDDEDNAGLVAESVQTVVMEAAWTGWPPCPRHPDSHPLAVTDMGWTCRDGTPVARIGELGVSPFDE